LKKTGFDFGSHTRTHANLSTVEARQACEEIETARADVVRELGDEGHLFAYPYGGSSPKARTCVAAAGYPAAGGVRRGLSAMHDDLYYLKRITIYGDENLLSFAVRVVLGDNPLDYLPWGRARGWMQRIES
jgi:peptidoglycan/xylan/chitin deacetylase (PgdA/CDA1 family)